MSKTHLKWSVLVPALALLVVGCGEAVVDPTPPPPPPPPAFTLAVLQSHEHFVLPTRLLALDLIIKRTEGFTEPITFRSEAPPEIVVQFNPGTVVGSDRTDVSIVASVGTVKTRHEIGLIGRSASGVEQKVILELTVE